MTSKKKLQNTVPEIPENPFRVPNGYFNNLGDRVMDRIGNERTGAEKVAGRTPADAGTDAAENSSFGGRKISMRPYLTLAASISGIALIIYILLQTVVGGRAGENGYYDIAMLDRVGVVYDEAIIAEAYEQIQESDYSEWDEDAMVYLSSNEVDLIQLLDSN
jgi:hypothetical protein